MFIHVYHFTILNWWNIWFRVGWPFKGKCTTTEWFANQMSRRIRYTWTHRDDLQLGAIGEESQIFCPGHFSYYSWYIFSHIPMKLISEEFPFVPVHKKELLKLLLFSNWSISFRDVPLTKFSPRLGPKAIWIDKRWKG